MANATWRVLILVIKQLSSIHKHIVQRSPMIVPVAHCAYLSVQLSTALGNMEIFLLCFRHFLKCCIIFQYGTKKYSSRYQTGQGRKNPRACFASKPIEAIVIFFEEITHSYIDDNILN